MSFDILLRLFLGVLFTSAQDSTIIFCPISGDTHFRAGKLLPQFWDLDLLVLAKFGPENCFPNSGTWVPLLLTKFGQEYCIILLHNVAVYTHLVTLDIMRFS
jgi:hypothetical protein